MSGWNLRQVTRMTGGYFNTDGFSCAFWLDDLTPEDGSCGHFEWWVSWGSLFGPYLVGPIQGLMPGSVKFQAAMHPNSHGS